MNNEQLAAAIAAFIVAHGAATLTVLWKGITLGIKKLIEWERLVQRVSDLETKHLELLEQQRLTNERLKKDIDAAFAKLRT